MKMESLYPLILPVCLVLAGYLAGKIFRRVAAGRLAELSKR